jgi:putative Mn2+ efflux pump MntP
MEITGSILAALSLSMICFSVALKSSIFRCIKWPESLAMSFLFALFQALMLALGWLTGFALSGWFFRLGVPIALLLILFLSARMIMDSRRAAEAQRIIAARSGRLLMGFSLVISINAFLLGLGLGLMIRQTWILYITVFSVVFMISLAGSRMGRRGFARLPMLAEATGGLILLLLAVILLLQYLKII